MEAPEPGAQLKGPESHANKQAPEPGKNWLRNRKKKRRQKLSKKFKAAAVQGGVASGHFVGPGPGECGSADEVGSHSKRAKVQAAAAARPAGAAAVGQKLSVRTLPAPDRIAQPPSPGVPSSARHPTTAPVAAAVAAAAAAQAAFQPASPCPHSSAAAPGMAVHHSRVDLSQAASLIHSELQGGGAASSLSAAARSQLATFSPAASGCHDGPQSTAGAGCNGPGGCPPLLAVGASAGAAEAAAPASSMATSVATSAAAVAAVGKGAQTLAVSVAGVEALPAGRWGGGGVLDSDCEGEDWGEAGEGEVEEREEDFGKAAEAARHAAGGRAGAAAAAVGGGKEGQVQRRRVYVYGNYHRYYGYRLGQAFGEDPRLQCFERSWFANRRCLDVGCNEGIVTLAIAMKFGCKSMMGVDIDEHLIRKACTHLREQRSAAVGRLVEVRRGGTPPAERHAARATHAALARTWFVHADFVSSEATPGSFNTIICLSVAKWVHLNQGDEGLEALLAKFWLLLAPGGLLLLEPQPWKSYRAAARKMRKQPVAPSTYFHRLDELKLRPEALPDLLVDRLGFRLVKRLAPPSSSAAGFDRPMFLFRRPA